MMAKYSPWAWENFKDSLTFGDVDYDAELVYSGLMPGDGQKMGLWVGAAWQKTYPVPPMINGGASGPAHGVISNFWGLNMDIHGERYQNECTNFAYGAISVLQLPQKTAYAVWDTAYAYTQDEWEQFGCCIDHENGIMPLSPEELIAYVYLLPREERRPSARGLHTTKPTPSRSWLPKWTASTKSGRWPPSSSTTPMLRRVWTSSFM